MGGKMKALAVFIAILGIIGSLLWGISFWMNDEILAGFLTIGIGSVISCLSVFTLYGFGELIENSEGISSIAARTWEMEKDLAIIAEYVKELKQNAETGAQPTHASRRVIRNSDADARPVAPKEETMWKCKKCGALISSNLAACWQCGASKR